MSKLTERTSRTGYLTMRQAAQWLGMGSDRAAARRLQRVLERLERATKQVLMLREGDGPGSRLRVTKAILRDYLPEHFSRREKLAGVVREQLNAIRTDVQKLRVENRVTARVVARILRYLDATELADDGMERPRAPTSAHGSAHPNRSATRVHPP